MATDPTSPGNYAIGHSWEAIFEGQARANGLIPLKNHLTAKMIGGPGSVKVIKSELDYTVILPARRDPPAPAVVGYFDCKSFEDAYIDYSRLSKNQIERSGMYCCHGVPSGFVCWHRSTGQVVFYSGSLIEKMGARTRFKPEHGIILGRFHSFDLRPILKAAG